MILIKPRRRRAMRRELDAHFERVRQTAHSYIAQYKIEDPTRITTSQQWEDFHQNVQRLGRSY